MVLLTGVPLDGDVAQFVLCQAGTLLMHVQFPGTARDFSPQVNFQCRLSFMRPYTPTCNRMH